jgi:enoyl-CoA hydratase
MAAVGAAVICGDGGYFCAGAHRGLLAEVGQDPTEPDRYAALDAIYDCFQRVGRLAVPVIAAVCGGAVGAGLNLMLATDIRIVSDDARLIAGFGPLGLHPGGGFFHLMTRAAGRQAAAALGLAGTEITGTRAADIGLAWESLPADVVEPRAHELANTAGEDPELARLMARSLRLESEGGLRWDAAVEMERAVQLWSLRRRTHNSGK